MHGDYNRVFSSQIFKKNHPPKKNSTGGGGVSPVLDPPLLCLFQNKQRTNLASFACYVQLMLAQEREDIEKNRVSQVFPIILHPLTSCEFMYATKIQGR